jgi:hypothetical protein
LHQGIGEEVAGEMDVKISERRAFTFFISWLKI